MMIQRTKNIYLLAAILLGITVLPACNKWLEVSPATQTAGDEQFSTLQGFTDILVGIYQKAEADPTYGKDMSWGLIDVLAQRYEQKTTTTDYYGEAARYVYTGTANYDMPTALSSIWTNTYGAIAQANYLLANVDAHKTDVLKGNYYNLFKGEAIGMRAMLHFDLLRLFAPAYSVSGGSEDGIPYMTEFTVKPQAKVSVAAALDSCESDLLEAESLLAVYPDIDQIADNQGSTSADLLMMYRQNHLNYWAVKAVLARLYLYKGDKTNALKYATEVINSDKFRFITQSEIVSDLTTTTSDPTFSREHIFSIYASNLKTLSDAYFNTTSSSPDNGDLFTTRSKLNDMYEISLAGYGTDVRSPAASQSLWYVMSDNVVYTKKYWVGNTSNVKQRLIPVIKLAEMYYIAAEAASTPAEGVAYLNVVREARLIPDLDAGIDAETLDAEILKEYRKEFYGEGQLWYYYKRKNATTIANGVLTDPLTYQDYVFPYPNDELEFGL